MTISLDDGDLCVCQDGPHDAPALLFIHGSAASVRSWDLLVPLLTESHRVVRLDLLGCGRSAKPDDADYAIPAQGRRIGQVLTGWASGTPLSRGIPAAARLPRPSPSSDRSW